MKHKVYLEYLVLSSQKGDSDALEKLIDHWQPRLLKHAWYLTGDGEVAKDMVQEAWMAAMKSFRNLQDPSRFRSWIYKIVTHKCADWVRRCQRQQKCYSEIPKVPQSEEVQNNDAFYIALNSLSKQHKTVLSLYYLEEMSVAEVAEILSISTGTVKSRLYHAREKLKLKLEGSQNG
ncbi:RNA polymerase sigma factor [Candidatus Uabimicrobium amorphum]|uniref:DNA-directed RNA polymerase sigma-70 factor n=1 Tax=Uabimicrobium amorphum TaxID=2596890 RepID=A0A5S9IR19_UABAM|nr:RNA polymerase sigma factor [Candidatus Uabimicrobium amorphum]BBM85882.1 DNA-directed RNA polymerase sigma-70 factor [Candidatus Uabimicrobium amorphum]